MSTRFTVEVDSDQFDRLARPTQPLAAVAELVWNSLDAEARTVVVSIGRTELGAVDTVVISDDGHGMTNEESIRDFHKLGGSWKRVGTAGRRLSKNGTRSLHGRNGEGRFRSFALGRRAEWSTIAQTSDGSLERSVIRGSMDVSEFVVSDPEVLGTGTPGTRVQTTDPRENVSRLVAAQATAWLITRFAVYLVKYPNVAVTYDGTKLDPSSILDRETEVSLGEVVGEYGPPQLRILEWTAKAAAIHPSLVLCDENGVALHEIENIETIGDIRFTAYVVWQGFSSYANELLLADLGHPTVGPVVDAARQAIREYLNNRTNEQRYEIIERWKAENVYPYRDAPKTPIEQHERRVFDAVAVTAAPAVAREPKAAKLSLELLKSALSESPAALHRILREVLDLTSEQLADFNRLLERTTLASIIQTSKLITDRLDFLADLESMLFDEENKQRLLERTQLHRILANRRTWVFGEEYGLAVDDKGLTKVLEAHRALLGESEAIAGPVTDAGGHTRIVDLMLSKAGFASERRQHLVIELKRPKLTLTQKELGQITNYAVAVVRDERFQAPTVSWDFWLLGDDMDEVVAELTHKHGQPDGLYQPGGNYRIWVRRWAEILEDNRQRLHFFREHLDYQPAEASELEATLSKYIPMREVGE